MHFQVGDTSPLDPTGQVTMQTSANRLIFLRIFDGVALTTTSNKNIATPVPGTIQNISTPGRTASNGTSGCRIYDVKVRPKDLSSGPGIDTRAISLGIFHADNMMKNPGGRAR